MDDCITNITRGCCFSKDENGEAHAKSCEGCQKMEAWDWLADLPDPLAGNELFEIQFKNTRKGYYVNSTSLELKKGNIVAVEASPGHDIGIVTLTGEMVTKQMRKTGFNPRGLEFKKIFRLAKPYDIEKWQEAIALEHPTMIRSRQIASELKLNMKIGDVEYQGDRLKAIFYYIADERVDFRELIKVLAEQFRIRIEMKQIGARQEAGRIGGIAACGRELCCSTWINNFSTVTIGSARHQEISLNPQKLAGQCGKLKCCLNYELDTYIEAQREFPRVNNPLETIDGSYYYVKSDTLRKIMYFSPDPHAAAIQIPLTIERVRKIMDMNRKGVKIDRLEDATFEQPQNLEPEFKNVVGEESITRFDKSGGHSARSRSSRGGRNRSGNRNNSENPQDGGTQRQDRPGGNRNNAENPQENRQRQGRSAGNRNNQESAEKNNDQRQARSSGDSLNNSGERRPQDSQRGNKPSGERPDNTQKRPEQRTENRQPRQDRQPRAENVSGEGQQNRSNNRGRGRGPRREPGTQGENRSGAQGENRPNTEKKSE